MRGRGEARELNNHLRRLEIDGFRGLENLVVDDLADVNVIVGTNNEGMLDAAVSEDVEVR
jgi:hypothetical protein